MSKFLLSILVIGMIAAAGWWYLASKGFVLWSTSTTLTQPRVVGENVPVEQPTLTAEGLATYTDAQYNFSLSYPAGYRIGRFTEGEGSTFVIQDNKGVGMQLVVTPFDEDIALTPARIQQDLPDMPMSDVREVSLPTAKIPAVVFKSSGGGFGESVELWFVHEGYLYQASSYLSQLTFLEGVMGTFHF